MSFSPSNIRTAIIELLDGTTSSVRQVTSGMFAFGVFEGQPDGAQRALIADTATGTHRFDVELGPLTDHESTSPVAASSRRLANLRVSIPVWTKTATTVEESARRAILATIRDDCDTAMQALAYPGNVRQTAAAGATDIASGCLTGLTWRLERAQWDRGVLMSRIEGECLVTDAHDLTADLFTASIFAAADSQLISFWLAHESNTYRALGAGGVAYLIDQRNPASSSHRAAQSTASRQPQIDSAGPNGRGRIVCSGDLLSTENIYTSAIGDRFGLFVAGAYTGPADSTPRHAITLDGSSGGGYSPYLLWRNLLTTQQGLLNYHPQTDTTRSWTMDSDPFLGEAWFSNPHSFTFRGETLTRTTTTGASSYAETAGGLSRITLGARGNGSEFWAGSIYCAGLVRMSGTSVPIWMPNVRSLIGEYYGEELVGA